MNYIDMNYYTVIAGYYREERWQSVMAKELPNQKLDFGLLTSEGLTC